MSLLEREFKWLKNDIQYEWWPQKIFIYLQIALYSKSILNALLR